jgi:biopolymer transport protein ExbD
MSEAFILPRRRRRIRPYLDLTAMIDTVFNLLIFFAVASSFVGARAGIDLRLPSAKTAQPVPERVVLTLMPGQPIQVDGRTVLHEEIGPEITRLTGGDLDTQIVVMADARVPYEELVAALDEVRLAKYHRIALAAKAKTEEQPPR